MDMLGCHLRVSSMHQSAEMTDAWMLHSDREFSSFAELVTITMIMMATAELCALFQQICVERIP